MLLNHLVLPVRPPPESRNIYAWLQGIRRLLIGAIIPLGTGVPRGHRQTPEPGLAGPHRTHGRAAVTARCPGVIYWPEGNRKGVIAGILVGTGIWAVALVLPQGFGIMPLESLGLSLMDPADMDSWHIPAFVSLSVNVLSLPLSR